YTTSNLRASSSDQSNASAYQLAQAGLAEALARLQGADDPTVTTLLSTPTTVNYPAMGGSATYKGTAVSRTDKVIGTLTSSGPATATGATAPNAAAGSSWVNPGNVRASDGIYATNTVAKNGVSSALVATSFGFTVPANAQILGVVATVKRKANSSGFLKSGG